MNLALYHIIYSVISSSEMNFRKINVPIINFVIKVRKIRVDYYIFFQRCLQLNSSLLMFPIYKGIFVTMISVDINLAKIKNVFIKKTARKSIIIWLLQK